MFSHAIESVMFRLVSDVLVCVYLSSIAHQVHWYDLYMYTPLQIHLSPSMARIPRFVRLGDQVVTVFNANIVTYSRTLLIIPIAWCLK